MGSVVKSIGKVFKKAGKASKENCPCIACCRRRLCWIRIRYWMGRCGLASNNRVGKESNEWGKDW
jgi:hypothetical protein